MQTATVCCCLGQCRADATALLVTVCRASKYARYSWVKDVHSAQRYSTANKLGLCGSAKENGTCQLDSLTRQASKERRARVKVMTLDCEAMGSPTQSIMRLTHCYSESIACKHSSTTKACTIQERFGSSAQSYSRCRLVVSSKAIQIVGPVHQLEHTSDARADDNIVSVLRIGGTGLISAVFSAHRRLLFCCSSAGHNAGLTVLPVQPLSGCLGQPSTSDCKLSELN